MYRQFITTTIENKKYSPKSSPSWCSCLSALTTFKMSANCEIKFDNNARGIFTSGQNLTGTVVLSLDKVKKFRGLFMFEKILKIYVITSYLCNNSDWVIWRNSFRFISLLNGYLTGKLMNSVSHQFVGSFPNFSKWPWKHVC